MLKVFYIHGFGSRFDPHSEKCRTLAELGEVTGSDLDYCAPADLVLRQTRKAIEANTPDLLVGCSMGGWNAAHMSAELKLPFVALNPATRPYQTLKKYVGTHIDYYDREFTLTPGVVESYGAMSGKGHGMVLLDEGDEVLDYRQTLDFCDDIYPCHTFSGGSHRFEHMRESLELIQKLIAN